MDTPFYLNKFQEIAGQLAVTTLDKTGMETWTGIWSDAVFIKFQKKAWTNTFPDTNSSGSSIFFSAWITDKAIKEGKIFYNIHALRLRKLNGYLITSREFATAFRERFKHFEQDWPNISTAFGPQTLMEGWEKMLPGNPGALLPGMVHRFLKINFIIDDLLAERKIPVSKNIP